MGLFSESDEAEDKISKLIVPLNAESAPTQAKLLEVLASTPLEIPVEPKVVISSGAYILYGDMFKNGRCYAIAELNSLGCIGFAVRKGAKWEVCGCGKLILSGDQKLGKMMLTSISLYVPLSAHFGSRI
jgi:hypothetical protein